MISRSIIWFLDRVPMWLRFRWPFKRFYLQPEQLEAAQQRAKELDVALGWTEWGRDHEPRECASMAYCPVHDRTWSDQ